MVAGVGAGRGREATTSVEASISRRKRGGRRPGGGDACRACRLQAQEVDESEECDRVAGSRRKGEERAAGRRHQAARKGDGDEDEKEREREETKKKEKYKKYEK